MFIEQNNNNFQSSILLHLKWDEETGRNRDADVDDGLLDTVGGGEGGAN